MELVHRAVEHVGGRTGPRVGEASAKASRAGQAVPLLETELPLVDVGCYMCGKRAGSEMVDDPPFKVIRCGDCGFAYVTPRVPDSHLHLIYQTEYFKSQSAGDFGYSDYTRDRQGYRRTFQKKADIVQRFVPDPGRVLEVGSAAGFFLLAMKERGYDTCGIEVSEYVSDFARDELGLDNVHTGLLHEMSESIPLQAESFDVAAMWDVIEHVSDPIEELRRLHGLLRGGRAVVHRALRAEP